jgi:hypothetical protein
MCRDFLSMRVRLATSTAITAEPFESVHAAPGKCWQNVKQLIESRGGTFAYGWAFSGLGPIVLSGPQIPPLYSRWCNHVIWRDKDSRLWEVTPSGDPVDFKVALGATNFILDDEAQFEFISDDTYCPQPAVYIAARPEGEWISDCLCQAERAMGEAQNYWLARTLYSLKQVGFVPTNWRLNRIGDKLRDIWIIGACSDT